MKSFYNKDSKNRHIRNDKCKSCSVNNPINTIPIANTITNSYNTATNSYNTNNITNNIYNNYNNFSLNNKNFTNRYYKDNIDTIKDFIINIPEL